MNVLHQIDAGVCEIRLNRPDKLNAITPPMWVALNEALDIAEADPGVRVVLFTGAGASFCAGADLNAFSADAMADGVPSGLDNPGGRFTARLPQVRKAMVAAVQGHVVGFGTSLVLQCDYVLAAPSARFLLPFVARGFVPEAGSSMSLPQRVGPLRAAQMMLGGEAVDAQTARDWALVTRVVEEAQLQQEAHAVAQRIAAQPPAALRRTRELLRQPSAEIAQQIRRESEAFSAQLGSEEVRIAIAAFLEKRKPDFSGCE
jgi:enoyl-CoA hydratase/carnithine racemase